MTRQQPTRREEHLWRGPLMITVIVVVAGMAVSLSGIYSIAGKRFWVPPLGHQRVWIDLTDFWWAERAAAYIANGALGYIYEGARAYYGLPLFPILLAPLVAVGQALGLEPGQVVAGVVPQPSMWLLLGPFVLATVFPLVYGVRRVMHSLGVTGTLPVELCAVVVVFGPALWPHGHLEDVLAIGFVLIAIAEAQDGHPLRGALFFSLAIASKQWSALGLPLFVLSLPKPLRAKGALVSIALPASLAAFVFAVDFRHARYSLIEGGGVAVRGRKAPIATLIGGQARLMTGAKEGYFAASPYRLAMFAVVILLAIALRKRLRPELLPAAFATTYLVRFILEPTPTAYYFAPALTFLLIDEQVSSGRILWTPLLGSILVCVFALHGSALWWGAVVAIAAAAALPSLRKLGSRRSPKVFRAANQSQAT